jgi:hypothetical protein
VILFSCIMQPLISQSVYTCFQTVAALIALYFAFDLEYMKEISFDWFRARGANIVDVPDCANFADRWVLYFAANFAVCVFLTVVFILTYLYCAVIGLTAVTCVIGTVDYFIVPVVSFVFRIAKRIGSLPMQMSKYFMTTRRDVAAMVGCAEVERDKEETPVASKPVPIGHQEMMHLFSKFLADNGYVPQQAMPEGGVLESVVPGSDFTQAPLPNYQVFLCVGVDKKYRTVGCGFRYGDHIVTAAHVLASVGEATLYITRDCKQFLAFSGKKDCSIPEFDVVLLRPHNASLYSTLQLKSAKLHRREAAMPVTVVGVDNRASMAMVKPLKDGFGQYEYHGSTIRGFSGSPYVSQGVVVGMHISGNPNIGYSSLFLGRLIDFILKKEDSTDLADIMCVKALRNQDRRFRARRLGDGRIMVKAGDEYLTMYEGELNRACNEHHLEVNFEDSDTLFLRKFTREEMEMESAPVLDFHKAIPPAQAESTPVLGALNRPTPNPTMKVPAGHTYVTIPTPSNQATALAAANQATVNPEAKKKKRKRHSASKKSNVPNAASLATGSQN